jgi:hypothetical protein
VGDKLVHRVSVFEDNLIPGQVKGELYYLRIVQVGKDIGDEREFVVAFENKSFVEVIPVGPSYPTCKGGYLISMKREYKHHHREIFVIPSDQSHRPVKTLTAEQIIKAISRYHNIKRTFITLDRDVVATLHVELDDAIEAESKGAIRGKAKK